MNKLRVGYIVDAGALSSFVYDTIQRSRTAEHYTIELLIVQEPEGKRSRGFLSDLVRYARQHGLARAIDRLGFAFIEKTEKILVRFGSPRFAKYFRRYPLADVPIEKLYVSPQISPSGFVYRYSNEDLQAIRDKQLDLLIRGGNGILRGDVLEACAFGIISFHHANNAVNRGGPAGFWEVFLREPSTGFVLQRLTSELDGGDVLFKGSTTTAPFYLLNQLKLQLKANIFLHRLLEGIGRERKLPAAYPAAPYAYPLYRMPKLRHQMQYLAKTYVHLGKKAVRKVFHRSHRWGVAYQFVNDWKSAVLWRSKIIENPRGRFLADPSVAHRSGQHVCFVEDFLYKEDKGSISAYQITREGHRELGTALKEPFHLSYPFLFEADGELYMCPETSQNKDIRIYRCTEFPLRWTLHKVLMSDVRAVDTTIFPASGRWWMLTNIDSSEAFDHGSELHVFFADRFDSSSWSPHPANPVIFDSARARNGGFIAEGKDLYRVYQVPGFDMYGASMGVARISQLSPEHYKEETVFTVPPRFFDGLKGTHTYAFADGLLVLDFVKLESERR